jgi:hypothetical protein
LGPLVVTGPGEQNGNAEGAQPLAFGVSATLSEKWCMPRDHGLPLPVSCRLPLPRVHTLRRP